VFRRGTFRSSRLAGHGRAPSWCCTSASKPLRERNRLLLAAGYAPVFEERSLDEPEMAPVRDTVQVVLEGHDPSPAIAVDHGWALVAHNRGRRC